MNTDAGRLGRRRRLETVRRVGVAPRAKGPLEIASDAGPGGDDWLFPRRSWILRDVSRLDDGVELGGREARATDQGATRVRQREDLHLIPPSPSPPASNAQARSSSETQSFEDWPGEEAPYERLPTDAMAGDGALFAREDGVEAAWAAVDPVMEAHHRVQRYRRGSWGPKAADALIAADGGWCNPTMEPQSCGRGGLRGVARPGWSRA